MKSKTVFIQVLILGFTLLLLMGCSQGILPGGVEENADPIQIAVSIRPQADLVQQIGGDKVEIMVMIPPGVCPEHYECSTGQLLQLSTTDLYISIGAIPMETIWMNRIQSANADMVVVDSSVGIEIIDGDPHIWLSPRLVQVQVENIYRALAQNDPDNILYYQYNKERFLAELVDLDQELQGYFTQVERKTFLVYHPAWKYFARDYGLQELAVEREGKEPSPRELALLIDQAREMGLKNILTSSYHGLRYARGIAEELGGEVIIINPMPVDYIEDMREMAQRIVRELNS